MAMSSLSFLFVSYTPGWVLEKSVNLETQTGPDPPPKKKIPKKNLFPQRTKNGKSSKTENFDNLPTPAKQTPQEKIQPHPTPISKDRIGT